MPPTQRSKSPVVEGIAREDGLDLDLSLAMFSVAEQELSVENSPGTGRAEA
ncbi:MAG: hypothetical protein KIT11_07120 [Fimbriimonadaceae bacterium]|nr:hypothetical protein [Fimbriimonadaceae bacterium]QYK56122.1 MAG: hypothetical protein KF733_01310 [Fimbriimonadaceae bacterium]